MSIIGLATLYYHLKKYRHNYFNPRLMMSICMAFTNTPLLTLSTILPFSSFFIGWDFLNTYYWSRIFVNKCNHRRLKLVVEVDVEFLLNNWNMDNEIKYRNTVWPHVVTTITRVVALAIIVTPFLSSVCHSLVVIEPSRYMLIKKNY